MTIEIGQKLPEANFIELGAEGPAPVSVADLTAGKKIALFAVPGAFTPTCHAKHVPSFVGAAEDLAGKGVDEIVCVFDARGLGVAIADHDEAAEFLGASDARHCLLTGTDDPEGPQSKYIPPLTFIV